MSEKENELLGLTAAPADTPEGHGGSGGKAVTFDVDSTTPQEPELEPADPPDGGGGSGG